jgi:hypothetical protein
MPGRCRRFPVAAVVKRVFKPSFPLVDRSSPVNARFAKKARAAPSIFNRWARVDSSGVGCRQRDFFSYRLLSLTTSVS